MPRPAVSATVALLSAEFGGFVPPPLPPPRVLNGLDFDIVADVFVSIFVAVAEDIVRCSSLLPLLPLTVVAACCDVPPPAVVAATDGCSVGHSPAY